MKLESIKLRGFIGIRKGLGVDDISLDLSSVSGLVALAGPNGKGKSTLLENLQVYRTLASRKRALQHHVFLRDSCRDLSFLFNGDRYRTLIKIDSDSEKQEGFIWKNGDPQVNGKVREYDRYIEELFGSSALFFNSVFCAQGSEKITDMTPGQIKNLFAEFLRLDRLIAWEQTSKQVGQVLAGKVSALDRELDYMRRIVETAEALEASLQLKNHEREIEERVITSLKEDLEKHSQALQEAKEAVSKNAMIQDRIASEKKALATARQEFEAMEREYIEAVSRLEKQIKAQEYEISRYKIILKDAPQIRAAVAETEERGREMISIQDAMEVASTEKDRIQGVIGKKRQEFEEVKSEIDRLKSDRDLALLSAKLDSLKKQSTTLDLRDPACQSTTCSFIVQALEAQKEIPTVEAEVATRKKGIAATLETLSRHRGRVEKDLHELRGMESAQQETLKNLRVTLADHRGTIEHLKPTAAKSSEIDIAETKLETAEKSLETLKNDLGDMRTSWMTKLEIRNDAIAEMEKRLSEITGTLNLEAEYRVKQVAADLDVTGKTIKRAETTLMEITKEISAMEGQIREAEKHKEQITTLEARRKAILADIGEWQYLQAACSANGLRALEIDSVAPGISAYANELLSQAFGPLFTVRFRTQDEETGREVLEIPVMREDGSEPLLENLSGGEKIWVLKALRLAMTLISKEKSARNFASAFADEEDGSLDVDNALNFVRLYRAFMQAGGFESLFFISHKPDVVSMADHQILFDGKIQVQ